MSDLESFGFDKGIMNGPGGLPSSSLSELVYTRVRQEILDGLLRPNEALIESELATRLGVSRTPVRESIQRLANEGLVISKRRRWVIYEHSLGEIVELYEIRTALESYAAGRAAERATPEQRYCLAAWREKATSLDVSGPERVKVNAQFHGFINRCSGNQRLIRALEDTTAYHFNVRLAQLYTEEDYRTSSAQHEEIIDAILSGDAPRAEKAAGAHIETALSRIRGAIEGN